MYSKQQFAETHESHSDWVCLHIVSCFILFKFVPEANWADAIFELQTKSVFYVPEFPNSL